MSSTGAVGVYPFGRLVRRLGVDPFDAWEGIMKKNEGNLDRIARVVVAVVAAIIAIAAGGALGVVLWIVAAVMLVTAAVGFCPLYRVLGVNTCRVPAPR